MLLRPDNCDDNDDDYNEGDDGDDEGNDGDDDYNEGVDGYDPSAHQDDWADKRVGEEADRVTEWRGHLFNFSKFQNHWILETLD